MNQHWVEMFPDPHSRPARHTVDLRAISPPPMQIQCDLMAVIASEELSIMKIADIRTIPLSYACDPPYASAGGMQARARRAAGRDRDR